jgi:hypothetical protein
MTSDGSTTSEERGDAPVTKYASDLNDVYDARAIIAKLYDAEAMAKALAESLRKGFEEWENDALRKLQDHLIEDVECNTEWAMSDRVRRRVEKTMNALIAGNPDALASWFPNEEGREYQQEFLRNFCKANIGYFESIVIGELKRQLNFSQSTSDYWRERAQGMMTAVYVWEIAQTLQAKGADQ